MNPVTRSLPQIPNYDLPKAGSATTLLIGTVAAVAAIIFLTIGAPATIPLLASVALLTVGVITVITSALFLETIITNEKVELDTFKKLEEQKSTKTHTRLKLLEQKTILLEKKNALMQPSFIITLPKMNNPHQTEIDSIEKTLIQIDAELNMLDFEETKQQKFSAFSEAYIATSKTVQQYKVSLEFIASYEKKLNCEEATNAREIICKAETLAEYKHQGVIVLNSTGTPILMPEQWAKDLPRHQGFYLNGKLAYSKDCRVKNDALNAHQNLIALLNNNELLTERICRYITQTSAAATLPKIIIQYSVRAHLPLPTGKSEKVDIKINKKSITLEVFRTFELRRTFDDFDDPKSIVNGMIPLGHVVTKRTVILPIDELANPDLETMDHPLPSMIATSIWSPLYKSHDESEKIFRAWSS